MAGHYPTIVNDLTGKLLISHPKLDGTQWSRSVIWMFQHSSNGAQGCVLNKLSRTTLPEAVVNKSARLLTSDSLYIGGPESPRGLFLVHSAEWSSFNTQFAGLHAVSSDKHMIDKMVMMNEPAYWRMCVGTATWAPGQLETELAQDLWLVSDADDSVMFYSNEDEQWELAIEEHSTQLFAQYL